MYLSSYQFWYKLQILMNIKISDCSIRECKGVSYLLLEVNSAVAALIKKRNFMQLMYFQIMQFMYFSLINYYFLHHAIVWILV